MPLYRFDFHTHCQGDILDRLDHSARAHVDRAVEMGLHAVALTWHRKVFDQPDIIAYAKSRGLLLIPGIETELDGAHLVVLNVQPGQVGPHITVEEIQALRKNPEIFVLAPHPFYFHPTCLGQWMHRSPGLFDGVEWCHYHVDWLPPRINPNARAKAWAQKYNKPLIATSDSHHLATLGLNYSEVEADSLTAPALFRAIREHKARFSPESYSFQKLTKATWRVLLGQSKFIQCKIDDWLGRS